MLDAFAIARRIKSRMSKTSYLYASGAFRDKDGSAMVQMTTDDGYRYRATVKLLLEGDPRPVGFTHIFEKTRTNQLLLAELASKAIAGLAQVSPHGGDMEPWHKDGVAGFVVRCAFGARYLVEFREVTIDEELAEAEAAAAARA